MGLPTRVVLPCDSDPRPPSRPGRVDVSLGSGWVLAGWCAGGAWGEKDLKVYESRHFRAGSGGGPGLE